MSKSPRHRKKKRKPAKSTPRMPQDRRGRAKRRKTRIEIPVSLLRQSMEFTGEATMEGRLIFQDLVTRTRFYFTTTGVQPLPPGIRTRPIKPPFPISN